MFFRLGSLRRSPSTGIILNDEMDDFSIPGHINIYGIPSSPSNFIKPGKRPMSSMAPTIIVDKKGDVKMIVGSAGGSRIITSVASSILHYLYISTNESLQEVFAEKRLHHQLMPNDLLFEKGFNPKIVQGLQLKKHNMTELTQTIGFGALVGIGRKNGVIEAAYDPRRGGDAIIF